MSTTTHELRLAFLVHSLRAISAHPVEVISSFLIVSLASAALKPELWEALEILKAFTVVTTTTVLATAGTVASLNRLPRKPKEPKRRTARPRSAGPAPSPTIPLLIDRCLVCRRPLKDPTSMRAGVGPDCRRRFGPRPQYQPNPDYVRWQQHVEELQREQAILQQEYDRAYTAQMRVYHQALLAWRAELSTPVNAAKASAVHAATRTMYVDLGVFASLVLSELVARAVAQV